MINYNELQKQVFNWLKEKNEKDQNFTFSLRRQARKGAEQNYFIGTEKSKYFSTTFWNIPVAYPGSAGELISLVFDVRNKNKIEYSIQFNQTKDPYGPQNKYALELIRKIKPIFLERFPHSNAAKESNKMEYFSLSSGARYDNFSEMIPDLESTLTSLIPLVDQQIDLFKKEKPDFIAGRISEEEQTKMIEKMGERLKKHEISPIIINNNKTTYFNTDGILNLTEIDNGNVRVDTFVKLEYLKEQLEQEIGIKFTSANHLEESAKNSNIILEIRFQPLDVKDSSFEIIMGFGNEDDADYESKTFLSLVVDCDDTKLAYSINEEYGVVLSEKDFPDNWKSLLEILRPKLEAIIKRVEILKITPTIANIDKMNTPVNQILYGPPGTGKTYNTINKAISIANPEFDLEQDRNLIKQEYSRLVDTGQIVFTTFHQSMSYEEFIEGIKPLKPEVDDEFVKYDIQNGIFKEVSIMANQFEIEDDNFDAVYNQLLKEIDSSPTKSIILETLVRSKEFTIYKNSKNNLKFHANTEKAYEGVIRKEIIEHYLKTGEALDWSSYTKAVGQYITEKFNFNKKIKEHQKKDYVLIIDEINRGNVSQIFGELITLIEEDKRIGNSEELQIMLPYSKVKFGVPPNLYIIGTMNTADRSVEALDSALRRRFVFEEMPPLYDLIELQNEVFGLKLSDILKRINLRIEKLLDSDHAIGHAYFLHKDENSIIQSFYKNIIPLLKEYFFGDHGKIGLVLGDGFVQKIENDSVFADFEYDGKDQYDEKESYSIMNHSDNQNAFQMALSKLMK